MNVGDTIFIIFGIMTLISSISGIRGTIGGKEGSNLTLLM
ncbi:MAG: hypothetical protein CM15mP59_5680 [Flavobacteriaceae bacterium]|nr:MAG: hypothetical protein CM15mP59_5680 [Flavobacteriaceae bacterium]